MSDAIILRKRQELLNKLRPVASGVPVGKAMAEPLPYFHTIGKGKPRIRRRRSPVALRPDESHKTRPNFPAGVRPPPQIAVGAAIGGDAMQMNAEIAQGVLLAGGAQAVGQRVGRPRRALRRSSGY